MSKAVTIKLDKERYEQLKELAVEHEVSISDVLRWAIKEYIEVRKK